jgi:hypothetical protein
MGGCAGKNKSKQSNSEPKLRTKDKKYLDDKTQSNSSKVFIFK